MRPPVLPDDDLASDMLDLHHRRARRPPACSATRSRPIARPGHRCAHNLNYWQFGDYLGIGAGAHGKLSFPHRVLRQVRWREPARYMAQALAGQAVSQRTTRWRARDLPFEFMLNALRLREGFELARFAERTGLPLSAVAGGAGRGRAPRPDRARRRRRVRPTARGFDFLSDLQALFLPPAATDRGQTLPAGAFPAAIRPLVPERRC